MLVEDQKLSMLTAIKIQVSVGRPSSSSSSTSSMGMSSLLLSAGPRNVHRNI